MPNWWHFIVDFCSTLLCYSFGVELLFIAMKNIRETFYLSHNIRSNWTFKKVTMDNFIVYILETTVTPLVGSLLKLLLTNNLVLIYTCDYYIFSNAYWINKSYKKAEIYVLYKEQKQT